MIAAVGLETKTLNNMKIVKAKQKSTDTILSVQYGANRLGNMRMWVEGKFYSDKEFNRKFKLITDEKQYF